MREFISGTNHTWTFYKWKEEYVLRSNCGENWEEFYFEVIPGVFRKVKFFQGEGQKPEKITFVEEGLYQNLMDKFFCPLRAIEKEDMIDIALKVLNKTPRLRYRTCMGWIEYEDKTKNPNYFGGTYTFPDGNEYTIALHRGTLSVFPGDVDAFAAICLRLPFISKRINLQQWADRTYKDEHIIINFEE